MIAMNEHDYVYHRLFHMTSFEVKQMSASRSLLGEALLGVFPPWPRDQLGRIATDDAAAQALRHHALQVAGPSSSAAFLRLPRSSDHTHATVQSRVQNTRFLYPSCHLRGLSRLERDMAIANKQLNQPHGTQAHRMWHKSRWQLVDGDEEVEALGAVEGKLRRTSRPVAHAWLPPRTVPLSHCARAEGPAALHRWSTLEHHIHISQVDRSLVPRQLRTAVHYFASSGRRLSMPQEPHVSQEFAVPSALTSRPHVVIHSSRDMLLEGRTRSKQLDDLEGAAIPQLPRLTSCWFLLSELPAHNLEVTDGHPVYYVAEEAQHVCIPLTGSRSVVDAEVSRGFLAAFPLPQPDAAAPDAPRVHVFLGESREWRTWLKHECVEVFGVSREATLENSEDVAMVNVAAAEELGLINWHDEGVKTRQCLWLPQPSATDPAAVPEEDAEVADEDTSLHGIPADETAEESATLPTQWGAGRRATLSAALSKAHVLPPSVLRELARATTTPPSPSEPAAADAQLPLVVAEDIAGITLLTCRSYTAMVNAADVQKLT